MKNWIWLIAVGSLHGQSLADLTAMIQKAPTAALYVERGSGYLNAGDPKHAIGDLDQALERDAVNVKALKLRARANSVLGKYELAITDLSGAIALSPAEAELFLARGDAYAAAGDARRALADREEAMHLSPEAYNEWMSQSRETAPAASQATATAGQTGQRGNPAAIAPAVSARIEPAKAVSEPPKQRKAKTEPKAEPAKNEPAVAQPKGADSEESASAHYTRGRDLISQNKFSDGIAELDRAIEMQPNNAIFYNARGYGYFRMKDYALAVQDFRHAVRLDANYLNALHNLALAYHNTGDQAAYNQTRERELQLGKKLGVKAP